MTSRGSCDKDHRRFCCQPETISQKPGSNGAYTMGILSWIVFGLIAGALAKWIMPGKN